MTTLQSTAPTFDDVWRTIQELALMSKETDRKFQETDRKFQETDRKIQETSQQMKETDRQIQETSQQMKETDRQIQETSHQMKDTDLRLKETDRLVKAVGKQLGEHGNRLGEFVQEMVRPAVLRLFQQRQLPVHQVLPNITAYDDNGQFRMEIDLLVINSDTAIAVECKSRLSQDDVNEHLNRLALFKDCFQQYGKFTILGAVAAMILPKDVGRYAYSKGLFVLAQSGDAVKILNDDAFKPHEW